MHDGRRLAAATLAALLAGAAALACGLRVTGGASDAVPTPPPDEDAGPPDEVDAGDGEDVATEPDTGPADPCASSRGPVMAAIPGDTCIDTTEVTRSQYASFVTAFGEGGVPSPAGCPPLDPRPRLDAGAGGPDAPIVGVPWCEASAFCAWAGKSLCTEDEWTKACTADGARAFPYGDVEEAGRCNVGTATTEAVPTRSGQCEGGYPGVFDMVGNVAEWVRACNAGTCTVRGGSHLGNATCAGTDVVTSTGGSPVVGFRCCR